MRIQTEILIDKYRDRLFAAAFSVCKNAEDADDVVQETFIKYHTQTRQFESEEHITRPTAFPNSDFGIALMYER